MRKAVIDVGSNSVLLTVSEHANGTWKPIFESTRVTGLGEEVSKTGILGSEPMKRTLSAIALAWKEAENQDCDSISAVATMAVRMASNAGQFQEQGELQGTPIQILSAEDEAKFGFLAVANDPAFSTAETLTMIDPGGQSTELATATRTAYGEWNFSFRRSFPVGTLGLISDFLTDEIPSVPQQLAACKYIDDLLAMAYLPGKCGTVVTVGATGTNLISIREKFETWKPNLVHGARLDYEEVSKAGSWLNTMSVQERSKVPGIEPGRAKTLPAGALILERFLFAVRSNECFVSIRGWRHALIENAP